MHHHESGLESRAIYAPRMFAATAYRDALDKGLQSRLVVRRQGTRLLLNRIHRRHDLRRQLCWRMETLQTDAFELLAGACLSQQLLSQHVCRVWRFLLHGRWLLQPNRIPAGYPMVSMCCLNAVRCYCSCMLSLTEVTCARLAALIPALQRGGDEAAYVIPRRSQLVVEHCLRHLCVGRQPDLHSVRLINTVHEPAVVSTMYSKQHHTNTCWLHPRYAAVN